LNATSPCAHRSNAHAHSSAILPKRWEIRYRSTNILLARLALVYAENGRGKTTLAAIFRSLATGDAIPITERRRLAASNLPHIVIDAVGGPPPATFQNGAWNRIISELVVFDDNFIDENVSSGLVVESEHRQNLHELILGAQGVALNRTLQQVAAQIETHNRTLQVKADAVPGTARGSLSVDEFCSLQARTNVDDEIQDAERNLAAAKQQDAIRAGQEFTAIALPPIDVTSIEALLSRDLPDLDRAADHVQAHVGRLGADGEAWVASGMQRIPGRADEVDGKPCPFCAQNLDGSEMIAHYRAYFGNAYVGLKQDVANTLAVFQRQHGGDAPAAFERAIRHLSEGAQFWSRFADIPAIGLQTAEIARIWATARDAIMTALANKQNAPLDRQQLPAAANTAIAAYQQVQNEVIALSELLQQANVSIRIVKEQAAAGNTAALEGDVARLKATKARHTDKVAPLCADYLAEKAAKAAAEQQRDAARTALDQYRVKVFPAYQTAINDYLRKFNAGFRLDQITSQNIRKGSACTYNVVINNRPVPVAGGTPAPGQPSFRNSLSAGDRNTLALAFFFASLDQTPNLADMIVVIDDPISSLDEHRTRTTVQEVRRLMQRAAQVIVLSHSKPFLCDIWDQTDPTLRGAIELVRDGDGSAIRVWDVSRDMITEHDRRHELLRDYLTAATSNAREVAHSLRLVMESFLRVAYPAHFPPGTMLSQFRGVCEQRVGTPRRILNQMDIDEMRDLTEYANLFHHDSNPAWQSQHINDAELLDHVSRTLAFTRR
jgi:wobble nucleotide-excising tRNase